MPTGYTADVQSGAVTDLRTFALRCARAFGACILQRDDESDALPTHREESPHYAKSLAEARERLALLEGMTPTEAQDAADRSYGILYAEYEKRKAENLTERHRYNAMLAEVVQWKPPTPEHVGLKDFMVEQLRSSIDFDDHEPEAPAHLSGPTWRATEISKVRGNVAYYEKSWREERERVRGANQWIDALYESLPVAAPLGEKSV